MDSLWFNHQAVPERLSGEGIASEGQWQDPIRSSLATFVKPLKATRACLMGILTRSQGEQFVISSDRANPGATSKRASRHINESYQVWTGSQWSSDITQAMLFATLDDADDYVRANYQKLAINIPVG
jgi:hypothetical protein